mmetsp:Transcript_36389/g.90902  ORF Transcript_36389/g.90902 Transcript_36389/m.90902 type:complete len:86 (-) Transcript_36389:590-847(-)
MFAVLSVRCVVLRSWCGVQTLSIHPSIHSSKLTTLLFYTLPPNHLLHSAGHSDYSVNQSSPPSDVYLIYVHRHVHASPPTALTDK